MNHQIHNRRMEILEKTLNIKKAESLHTLLLRGNPTVGCLQECRQISVMQTTEKILLTFVVIFSCLYNMLIMEEYLLLVFFDYIRQPEKDSRTT